MPSRFIAHVVLPAPTRVRATEVVARLGAAFPVFAGQTRAIGDTLIQAGPRQIVLMVVDAPLPAQCFRDDAHQRAWPDDEPGIGDRPAE